MLYNSSVLQYYYTPSYDSSNKKTPDQYLVLVHHRPSQLKSHACTCHSTRYPTPPRYMYIYIYDKCNCTRFTYMLVLQSTSSILYVPTSIEVLVHLYCILLVYVKMCTPSSVVPCTTYATSPIKAAKDDSLDSSFDPSSSINSPRGIISPWNLWRVCPKGVANHHFRVVSVHISSPSSP